MELDTTGYTCVLFLFFEAVGIELLLIPGYSGVFGSGKGMSLLAKRNLNLPFHKLVLPELVVGLMMQRYVLLTVGVYIKLTVKSRLSLGVSPAATRRADTLERFSGAHGVIREEPPNVILLSVGDRNDEMLPAIKSKVCAADLRCDAAKNGLRGGVGLPLFRAVRSQKNIRSTSK